MKLISQAVHQTIHNYQLTSKSKLFKRLTLNNEDRISKKIVLSKQEEKLLKLISQRDHYCKKIYELLNRAGEPNDPRAISTEEDAEYYLKNIFPKHSESVQQVRSITQKHEQFQTRIAEQRRDILKKHEKRKTGTSSLAKLESLNAVDEAKRVQVMEKELQEFFEEIRGEQNELTRESERMLSSLGIPFFVPAAKNLEGLLEKKEFALRVLNDVVR